MHATGQQQQGARSPKPVNGSAATSPLKHSPDSMQNSSSNLSRQAKGKKRERGDQLSVPMKRERFIRVDDRDSGQLTSESVLRLEIAKLAEKGALVDSETVERLVQLIQPVKPERKIDLTGRSILAGVIAATEKRDCLSQFVQLRGLPVLDEWLQEVHKGKICYPGNVKDNGKPVEEFLLVLLRALDNLPVNLNALQMCNIGKSVNHLRSHKNGEIQKKARGLVDTWKKRVEAEINNDDAKSGSSQTVTWPGRSRHDSSHSGSRHSSGSSEAAIRSSVTHHSSLKSASVKLNQGDSTSKFTSVYPGGATLTSTATNYKDGQSRISANTVDSELPQAVVKAEKSSSSSQSHTNSHRSGDHAKNMAPSGKERTRNSTARSRSSKKMTSSGSKLQKSTNDLQGAPACGVQRDAVLNRGTSVARISVVEKVSDDANAVDASVHEAVNHKLTVRIPNRCRSTAQSIAAGTVEDSSCRSSRASSPALSEKQEQSSARLREKHDPCQSNEVDGSSTSVHHSSSHENKRIPIFPKVASSPARNEMKLKKVPDSSFSSMNALVESCVKFSETNAAMSAGDEVGMNLLASVAAGEISKSATVSPSVCPRQNPAAAGNSCRSYSGSRKQLNSECLIQQQSQSSNNGDVDKCNIIVGVSKVDDVETSCTGTSSKILHQNEEGCLKSNGNLNEQVGVASLPPSPSCPTRRGAARGTEILNGESTTVEEGSQNQILIANQVPVGPAVYDEVKVASLGEKSEKGAHSDTVLYPSSNVDDEHNIGAQRQLRSRTVERRSVSVALQSESKNISEKTAVVSPNTGEELATENSVQVKPGKTDDIKLSDHSGLGNNRRIDQEHNCSPMPLKQEDSGLPSIHKEQNTTCKKENVENKDALVHHPGSTATKVSSSTVDQQDAEVHFISKQSDLTHTEEERKDNGAPATGIGSQARTSGGSDIDTKPEFDLNEDFIVDDVKDAEPVHSGASPDLSVNRVELPVSSASGRFLASVSVATAAKGPYVPPDDLLKNKTELGWKESARKSSRPDTLSYNQARLPLDFDLNVADERILFEVGCQTSGQESNNSNNPTLELMTPVSSCRAEGLDLDLNKTDKVLDVGGYSGSNGRRLEFSTPPIKALASGIFSKGEASGWRDFDLNNGSAVEDIPVEQISYNQHSHSNIPQASFGPRINGSDVVNYFSWYPQGGIYSVSMTPSALPDRKTFPIAGIGSGPQRVMDSPASNLSFNHDGYKGSMFSSTPAVPFHSSPFQCPVFSLGTSFPLHTSALSVGSAGFMDPATGQQISTIPSQLVGTAAAVPFHYPHTYVVSRPTPDAGHNGVVESHQQLGKQGLDLNAGPDSLHAEGRGETLPMVSKHLPVTSSHSLAEEQTRMYNMADGILKGKEPEGGWAMDKLNFNQSSWR